MGGSRPVIRVLVVDDHEMFAEILVRILAEDREIEMVGAVTTAAEGVAAVRALQPEIVLMDFGLPDMDGATAIRLMKAECPTAKVITVTGSDQPGAFYSAIEAGTSAWVRKTAAVRDVLLAIHRVHNGELVTNNELSALPPLEQLTVHYQPILELATERVAGFEALVRWQHPDRGLVLPGEFLPGAEETGFIREIGSHVGEVACRQFVTWTENLDETAGLWVSLNVSASGVRRGSLTDDVAKIIESTSINPASLVLEVTESVLIDDAASALTQLKRLKGLGIKLSLDDFGTGYSSLAYLREFPFDHVKLDMGFTAALPHSTRGMKLAESIHQMTSALGMQGIAEGVEREEQARALRDIGWEYGQGFLYSRAVDGTTAEALYRRSRSERLSWAR
jgi:EAL domain-containing protein (putative c-di-GMP-specific phosphodiesterase class I)